MPTIEDFTAECRAFFDARYQPRRRERKQFVWGEGSDSVAVFEEADREAEKAVIANVRAWRRALWGAGLGWVTGPAELGGRGLRKQHQQVLDAMAREYDVPGNGPLTVRSEEHTSELQSH